MRIAYKVGQVPSWFRHPRQHIRLQHTVNSKLCCSSDKYGKIEEYNELDLMRNEIVDVIVEEKDRSIVRMTVRGQYSPVRDVYHVLEKPEVGFHGNKWIVRYAWSAPITKQLTLPVPYAER